jgi:hypothetical protein
MAAKDWVLPKEKPPEGGFLNLALSARNLVCVDTGILDDWCPQINLCLQMLF